jgi:hypothetical protein
MRRREVVRRRPSGIRREIVQDASEPIEGHCARTFAIAVAGINFSSQKVEQVTDIVEQPSVGGGNLHLECITDRQKCVAGVVVVEHQGLQHTGTPQP